MVLTATIQNHANTVAVVCGGLEKHHNNAIAVGAGIALALLCVAFI